MPDQPGALIVEDERAADQMGAAQIAGGQPGVGAVEKLLEELRQHGRGLTSHGALDRREKLETPIGFAAHVDIGFEDLDFRRRQQPPAESAHAQPEADLGHARQLAPVGRHGPDMKRAQTYQLFAAGPGDDDVVEAHPEGAVGRGQRPLEIGDQDSEMKGVPVGLKGPFKRLRSRRRHGFGNFCRLCRSR